MEAIVLAITLFLAPTPTHPAVEIKTLAMVAPSAQACIMAGGVMHDQAMQDPKILDMKWSCFSVQGDVGKSA